MINDIAKYAATVLLTIVISMTGFWMMIGREYVTRSEAEIISDDKIALLAQRFNDKIESDKKIVSALDNNTQAINEFKIQIATLGKTLEYVEKQIEGKKLEKTNY